MQQRIILCDLDKTLIDKSYHLTIPAEKVRSVARRCADAGIVIGLCSDSPLPLLEQWAEELGFTGPIVFEQGAGFCDAVGGSALSVLPNATDWFPRLRDEVVRLALTKVPRYGIYIGDNTTLVRNGVLLPGPCEYYLLVSGTRRYSFAAHVRRRDATSGLLVIDPVELRRMRLEIEAIARSITDEPLDVDENAEYGTLIIHAARTRKANGVRALLERMGATSLVFIGDSKPDFIGDPRVIQCAVGNAQEEYKQHCQFVAQGTYTAGVIELLEMILANPSQFFG